MPAKNIQRVDRLQIGGGISKSGFGDPITDNFNTVRAGVQSSQQRRLLLKNVSAVNMPGDAVGKFNDIEINDPVVAGVEITQGPGDVLFVNDGDGINAGALGNGWIMGRYEARKVLTDGNVNAGDTFGPVDSSWICEPAGTGLIALSNPDAANKVWAISPGGAAQPLKRFKVTTEIPPQDGSGSQNQTGHVELIIDDAGTTDGNPQPIWNQYSGRIPVDVVGHCEIRDDGAYELVTANCDPEVQPVSSPIETVNDPHTTTEGEGTLIVQ